MNGIYSSITEEGTLIRVRQFITQQKPFKYNLFGRAHQMKYKERTQRQQQRLAKKISCHILKSKCCSSSYRMREREAKLRKKKKSIKIH